MPMQNVAPHHAATHAPGTAPGPHRGARRGTEGDRSMDARRRRLDGDGRADPLARVASLLIAISRNNSYEGRNPNHVPETLSSGFVADLLGLDITVLAAYLVELRNLGLL